MVEMLETGVGALVTDTGLGALITDTCCDWVNSCVTIVAELVSFTRSCSSASDGKDGAGLAFSEGTGCTAVLTGCTGCCTAFPPTGTT